MPTHRDQRLAFRGDTMTIQDETSSSTGRYVRTGDQIAEAAAPGSFILNLCPLERPITVPQPQAPEFQRFHFFIGRCISQSGERFFLTMGFFSGRDEAEQWLCRLR